VAIQFKCPTCDATIRVPDTSAGKKGSCPQCQEKLIVPTVAARATPTVAATVASTAISGATKPEQGHLGTPHIDVGVKKADVSSNANIPSFDTTALAVGPGSPPFGLPPLIDAEDSSVAEKLVLRKRQKKEKGKLAWLVPALCGLVLFGALGAFYFSSQPKVYGVLTAQVVPDMETRPALISGDVSGLEPEDLQRVLERLRASPIEWSSASIKIKLAGADNGLSASIQPGPAFQFVKVQPSQNQALLDFIKKHGDQLEAPRLAEIQQHAPELFSDLLNLFTKKSPIVDQAAHRDEVIFPSLVTGVGYHFEAAIKGIKYPCVFEDTEGGIYFLAPIATKTFTLQGRKIPGSVLFPASFIVQVDELSDAAELGNRKPQAKSKRGRQAENQDINPNRGQSETDAEQDASTSGSTARAVRKGLADTGALDGMAPNTKPKSTGQMDKAMMGDAGMPSAGMPNDSMPAKPKLKSKPAVKPVLK
jgi:hypothetical protein